jgi:hypothetical protein
MDNTLKSISFNQAKTIAEQHAFTDLEGFGAKPTAILKDESLEAEHCWMFFRNEQINVPDDALLGIKWAYVVSKKGTYSMVQDLSGDHKKLLEYLQKLSDNFKARNE